jgi:hypothetical protein
MPNQIRKTKESDPKKIAPVKYDRIGIDEEVFGDEVAEGGLDQNGGLGVRGATENPAEPVERSYGAPTGQDIGSGKFVPPEKEKKASR